MDLRLMSQRRIRVVPLRLAAGVAVAMLLTSCILIVPDTQGNRPVRLELPTPAKNPTVSYLTVDLDELSCDQLRVVVDALPKPRRARRPWGARATYMQSSPRAWQIRRRVREVENAIAARCAPVEELPPGL